MVTHGNRLEEEVFDFVRESEEAALGKAAETVGEFLPVEVPVVSELIEGILEFTEAVLKTQREFAQRILEQTRNAVDHQDQAEGDRPGAEIQDNESVQGASGSSGDAAGKAEREGSALGHRLTRGVWEWVATAGNELDMASSTSRLTAPDQ